MTLVQIGKSVRCYQSVPLGSKPCWLYGEEMPIYLKRHGGQCWTSDAQVGQELVCVLVKTKKPCDPFSLLTLFMATLPAVSTHPAGEIRRWIRSFPLLLFCAPLLQKPCILKIFFVMDCMYSYELLELSSLFQ